MKADTITRASLRAAAHVLGAAEGASLALVLERLLAGDLGRSDWLLRYWSRERLFSTPARRSWLAPDLAPLPYAPLHWEFEPV